MRDIQTAYSNYAQTSDPNTPQPLQQHWPSSDGQYVFGTPSSLEDDYRGVFCDFWDTIGYTNGGDRMMNELITRARKNRVKSTR
jgi:hypothetical protein